MTVYRVG